jgi:hypothetical protein
VIEQGPAPYLVRRSRLLALGFAITGRCGRLTVALTVLAVALGPLGILIGSL